MNVEDPNGKIDLQDHIGNYSTERKIMRKNQMEILEIKSFTNRKRIHFIGSSVD